MNPQPSRIFRPEPNVPVELSLAAPQGLNVSGNFGPQVLFSLTTGQRLYVPPEVGAEISALTLAPGQPFTICKRSRESGRGFTWEVERKAPQPAPSAPAPRTHAQTQIESALKTAVKAAYEAERFATEIGYTVRFSEESIRAMAITVLIGEQGRAA
jgi:hypothetical protein